jgi:hypothetical protein
MTDHLDLSAALSASILGGIARMHFPNAPKPADREVEIAKPHFQLSEPRTANTGLGPVKLENHPWQPKM